MSNFDYVEGKHRKTRAVGQLFIRRPGTGYDNRVMQATIQEVEFENSKDADRYMEHLAKKLPNRNALIGSRRLKLASISSD